MASDEGKHAVNDVGACEEWCAACRKARKQAASDEGRARALVERLRARYENALPAGGETTWIRLADFGALLAALTAAEQERDEAVREFHAAINEPA